MILRSPPIYDSINPETQQRNHSWIATATNSETKTAVKIRLTNHHFIKVRQKTSAACYKTLHTDIKNSHPFYTPPMPFRSIPPRPSPLSPSLPANNLVPIPSTIILRTNHQPTTLPRTLINRFDLQEKKTSASPSPPLPHFKK